MFQSITRIFAQRASTSTPEVMGSSNHFGAGTKILKSSTAVPTGIDGN